MNLLAPQFVWIAAGVSAAVVAIHFIVTRQPRSEPFPTARFVPESSVQAVSNAKNPTDLLVLLLRVLAIMCVGTALARPALSPERAPMARIFLADISLSSKSKAEVRDSVLGYHRPDDLVIAFDSAARLLDAPDSLVSLRSSAPVGNISAAIIAAVRASSRFYDRADSVSLILVSSLPEASFAAATDTIRSMWPGAINIIRVAPGTEPDVRTSSPVIATFEPADPLRYAVVLAGRLPHASGIRFVRSGQVDGAEMSGDTVLLHWPDRAQPLLSRPARSEHTALVSEKGVVVSHFSTEWEFPVDSMSGVSVIARWEDGTPAAVQRNTGSDCIRSTNIPIPQRGDLVLRPEFVAIVSGLLQPCSARVLFSAAPDSYVTRLRGGTTAAPGHVLPAPPPRQSPFTIWLLMASIGFLVMEQIARRSSRGGPNLPPRPAVLTSS